MTIAGEADTNNDTAAHGNLRTVAGLNPFAAWSLTANVGYLDALTDAGGFMTITVGDPNGPSAQLTLGFNAGDGALNQVSTVTINDVATSASAGPFTFTANLGQSIALIFDGTNLNAYVNGVLAVTLPAADLTATADQIGMRAACANVTNLMFFSSITITQ